MTLNRRIDHVDDYFGTRVADPYRWLEDDHSTETAAWVEAQNRQTFALSRPHPLSRRAARAHPRARGLPKYGAPFRKGAKVFFFLNDGLQNQSVLYVQDGLDGTPEVLLDPNTFSADGTVALASFTISQRRPLRRLRDDRDPGLRLAPDPGDGHGDARLRRRDARWVRFSAVAWRGDGFFYSRYPEPAPGTELTAPVAHQKSSSTASARAGRRRPRLRGPGPSDPIQRRRGDRGRALRDPHRLASRGRRGNDLWRARRALGENAFRPIVEEIGDDSFDVVDNVGDALLVLTNRDAPNRG